MSTIIEAPEWVPYTRSARVLERTAPEGRTIHVVAVPWDTPVEVWDSPTQRYTEVWQRGAFAKSISEQRTLPFCYQHDLHDRIGVVTRMEEQDDGLHAWAQMKRGQRYDELLWAVEDGIEDGFSIRFQPIRPKGPHRMGEQVLRQEARPLELTLTGPDRPALPTRVVEVRTERKVTIFDVAELVRQLRQDPAESA